MHKYTHKNIAQTPIQTHTQLSHLQKTHSNTYTCNILTSDPAGLSDEKCTCVNNRCIRSKILGDNLDCRRVELSANCDATGCRWMSNNYISRVRQEVSKLERRCWNENHIRAESGPPIPRLSSPGERERNAVMARRVGVNMLQFCSVSDSSLKLKTFRNHFEPFRIK